MTGSQQWHLIASDSVSLGVCLRRTEDFSEEPKALLQWNGGGGLMLRVAWKNEILKNILKSWGINK